VNLSCSALAEPGADFTWIKDNRTIQTSDDVEIFNATRHLSILQVSRSSMVVILKIHSGHLNYWQQLEIYTSEYSDSGLYFGKISSTLNNVKGSKMPYQKRPKCNDRATL
jgi:hypothetical protein